MLEDQCNTTIYEIIASKGAYYLASNFTVLINVVTFLIFLPILNHILIPFIPGFSMRIRIGCGLVCNLLCVAIATLLQVGEFNLTSYSKLGWLVVPVVLLSLGDALTVVTSKFIEHAVIIIELVALIITHHRYVNYLFLQFSNVRLYYPWAFLCENRSILLIINLHT